MSWSYDDRLIDRISASLEAALMNETVEVRLRPSFAHTVLAVLGCFGLFIAGIFVGRATKTDEDPRTAIAAESAPAAPAVSNPFGNSSGEAVDLPRPETPPEPRTEVLRLVDEVTSADAPRITVESLESGLADIDLQSIDFDAGTAELTTHGRSVVNQIATALNATPFIPVEVEVSTFTEATPGTNHGLSTQRAQAIVSALTAEGVSASRLSSIGLGSRAESPMERGSIVLFTTNDPDLARGLRRIDRITVEYDDAGRLTSDGEATIERIEEVLVNHPGSQLTLVGYGYATSRDTSHELSHSAVDVAAQALERRGIEPERIERVGLGDAPLNLQLDNLVELEVGIPAAISLALQQVDGEVAFVTHTDTITSRSRVTVAEIASAIDLDDELVIEISMHAYTERTSQENHDLSELQGRALVEALATEGVEPQRLRMVAHGDPRHFARPGRETFVTFYALG